MLSSRSVRLSFLLGSLACLGLSSPSGAAASTCDSEPAVRWLPERSWPSACEPAALTDGYVLLEGDRLPDGAGGQQGELKVVIERVVQGQAVETFAGKVTRPDAVSALFKSERPLPAGADFRIVAVEVAADGSELGPKFTSAFTTGSGTLPALAFDGAPTMKLEQVEQELYDCTKDECGVETCKPTNELDLVKSLRIAVPPVVGGIDLRSYALSAKLVATGAPQEAPVVATSDTTDTQAGKRSFLVLKVPPLDIAAEGCVTITATDAAGHTIESAPICTALPADVGPAFGAGVQLLTGDDSEVAQGEAPAQEKSDGTEYGESTDALTEQDIAEASAGGCSVVGRSGSGGASAAGLVALALTMARLRGRKRDA